MSHPGAMSVAERDAFLADVHVGVLSIDEPGRGPMSVPIWYEYEDGKVLMGILGTSLKGRLLRAGGRATLVAQTEAPPYRYVSIEGPVTVVTGTHRDDLSMATRYLGEAMGKWYVENNPSTSQSALVTLTPEHWRTMDFGKLMR